jgi:hypothetical protein
VVVGFGPAGQHEQVLAGTRQALPPLWRFVTPMPCVAVQLLDEVRAWGFHAYDFETYLADLSDEATEVVAEHLPRKNSPLSVLVQHEREETGMRLRDLWASHPAIAGGSVHHVHAVSSRATPSPPSRRQAARSTAPTTRFTTVPGTQKALSLLGKDLDLRKLVAGAGFEPATSGL